MTATVLARGMFFGIARESGMAPDALLSIFDRVLSEEARHIVFFVNWLAYERARRTRGAQLRHALAAARAYGRAMFNVGAKARMQPNGSAALPDDGTLAAFADLTLPGFLAACVREQGQRMEQFDRHLLRPSLMPTLARGFLGAALVARLVDRFASKSLLPKPPR